MITLEKVAKQFGKITAVNQVSLSVEAGEIFGLVGPDGAGKTTTIRMIIGAISQTSGKISILGEQNLELIKHAIGYVPQKFSLYGDLTVMENVRFIGSMYGASAEKIEALADEILSFTNLLPFKNRLADNLSGGMKQKLALAAGLMHRPKIFFLDEPTTGVDPVSRREFWQMLYKLNKEGATIFVSTPYMDEAELCTRIAFMDHGQIISCAAPHVLKESYPYRLLELQVSSKNIKDYLKNCPIREINTFGDKYHLVVNDPGTIAPMVESALAAAAIPIISLQEIAPSIEDVFVELANEVN